MTPPQPLQVGENVIMRFPVQDARHAILLKLAAMLNFLNGARILCEAGVVLGQGALERMADEAGEDTIFLTRGILNGMSTRHEEFLNYFWREDFSNLADIPNSFQSRPQVPREKIAASIHADNQDPSTGNRLAKVLSKSYSGFVHAAAPHVMEIYDDCRGIFGISAAPDHRQLEHEGDLWNYMYRGAIAFMFAAKVLGTQAQFDLLGKYLEEFQYRTGRSGGYRRE